MKLNNQQGITDFNPELIATTCSPRHIQSVLEDCKAVMKECERWIGVMLNPDTSISDSVEGLEKCLKALKGELK